MDERTHILGYTGNSRLNENKSDDMIYILVSLASLSIIWLIES